MVMDNWGFYQDHHSKSSIHNLGYYSNWDWSECVSMPGSPEKFFAINNIEIFEETSLVGPFFREMATAHLCCGVLPTFM